MGMKTCSARCLTLSGSLTVKNGKWQLDEVSRETLLGGSLVLESEFSLHHVALNTDVMSALHSYIVTLRWLLRMGAAD